MNREDVIKKASGHIGSYGNPNVFTKYFFKDAKKHAWCGAFCFYVFKHDLKSNWLDDCKNFGYVPTIVSWAKQKGYWTTDYKKAKSGDLVVYNWYPSKKSNVSHVGIVKEFKSNTMTSIEGNTTNGSKDNCVAIKKRNKVYIAGIVQLPYVDAYNLTRTLKKGCRGVDVQELQKELKKRKYDVGAVDGIFGDKTKNAVKKFQKDNKLYADGIVGKNTAHKLGWTYKGK